VDIDPNYIGQLDREGMQRERSEIVKATEQITKALRYKVQRSADDYALNEWFLARARADSPTSVQLGNRFAQKIITQWLDVNPGCRRLHLLFANREYRI
jgi:hypothetical protein